MFWWKTVCGLKLSSQDKTKQKVADITQSQVWVLWEIMTDNFCYLLVKPLLRGQWVNDGCFEIYFSYSPSFPHLHFTVVKSIFIFIAYPIKKKNKDQCSINQLINYLQRGCWLYPATPGLFKRTGFENWLPYWKCTSLWGLV